MSVRKFLSLFGFVSILAIPGILMYSQPSPFVSFNLELNTSGSVYVQWKMSRESTNVQLEVQRSADQKIWKTIEKIAPQLNTQYSCMDIKPLKGTNHYRIKIINEKGQSIFSEVQTIVLEDKSNFYLWPQPVTTVLHVEFPFKYGTFEIIDAQGRTAQKRSITAYKTDISVKELPEGVYFARIKHDSKVWIKKFIKQ